MNPDNNEFAPSLDKRNQAEPISRLYARPLILKIFDSFYDSANKNKYRVCIDDIVFAGFEITDNVNTSF